MIIEAAAPKAERSSRADQQPPRREAKQKTAPREPSSWRYWVAGIGAAFAFVTLFLTWRQIDHYLTREPRFALPSPVEAGGESSGLRLEGVKNGPRDRILRIFEQDYGRSIYRFPLAERRRELLAIDWIKQASVLRLWPNQIHVLIDERVPVAYARIDNRVQLVDAEGVLLDPHSNTRFALPVIQGLSSDMPEAQRQLRVARVQRLVKEAGPAAVDLSEVDAADPENLKVTQKIDNRAVLLLLGREHFRERLENFYAHIDEIRERYPNARVLDLRLEDRITAAGGGSGARQGEENGR